MGSYYSTKSPYLVVVVLLLHASWSGAGSGRRGNDPRNKMMA